MREIYLVVKQFIRKLPQELTSYDLLKTLAVVTMIIDHIGLYFFPDDVGWRIVGAHVDADLVVFDWLCADTRDYRLFMGRRFGAYY